MKALLLAAGLVALAACADAQAQAVPDPRLTDGSMTIAGPYAIGIPQGTSPSPQWCGSDCSCGPQEPIDVTLPDGGTQSAIKALPAPARCQCASVHLCKHAYVQPLYWQTTCPAWPYGSIGVGTLSGVGTRSTMPAVGTNVQ